MKEKFRNFLEERIKKFGIDEIKKSLENVEGPSNEDFFGERKARIISKNIDRLYNNSIIKYKIYNNLDFISDNTTSKNISTLNFRNNVSYYNSSYNYNSYYIKNMLEEAA